MNNWQQLKLIDVADIKLSNVDKKTKPGERTIKLCNYTDVYKNSFINSDKSEDFMVASCKDTEYEKFILKKGQVAITKDSEKPDDIGIPTYIAEDFDDVVLGYHLSLITPDEDKLDGRFLNYWLNTKHAKRYFENNAGGSGQRCTLILDTIKSIPLHLPELETQKQIAKVLYDLDAKIEVNNKINAELEAMAKLIYDYWFVQFEFPTSEAQAQRIGNLSLVGKPYKSSGGKMVYNEELKREIPEGWTSNTMADWIESDANGDWGESEPTGNYTVKVNCIRGADLPSLDGLKENQSPLRYIHENKTYKILESNDLIVEISGGSPTQSTGRISFVTEETFKRYEAPLICANFCKAVRLKEPKNLYNFYYTWKEAFEQGNMFNYEGKTSGIRNLLFSSLVESFKVPIPDAGVVEKFYDFMKPIQKQKQRNLLENQKLAELRDWLLPMLMNGQVTVGEAEEQLGMVAEENGKYGKV